MEKKVLTLKEQEEEEEQILEKEISNLNLRFKSENKKDLSLYDKEDDSDNQCDSSDNTENPSNSGINKSFSQEENDFNFRRSFISQNITTFDEVIKLIIIGEKKAGKSTFINNIMKNNNNIKNYYSPTTSLEINKVIKTISGQQVQIELWDTCETILNSVIIKTYYRISNGFVVIIHENTNMNYIIEHLENIQNTLQRNLHYFIIYNNFNDKIKNENELPLLIQKGLKEIMTNYLIEFNILNINQCDFDDINAFKTYINGLIRSKSQTKYKSVNF